jgi:hypothetical protein
MIITLRTILLAMILCILSREVIAQDKTGLVAYWRFNEKQGDLVKDSSGNEHVGKIFKAKRVKGIEGNALEFNGVDSYVECDAKNINFSNKAITIVAWIKLSISDLNEALGLPGGVDDVHKMIVSKASPAWYLSCRKSIFFSPWLDGRQTYLESKKSISAGEWHQVACSWDAQSGQYRTYLDGKPDLDITRKGNSLGKNTRNILIGAYTAKSKKFFFKGAIDEVAIYDKALTPAEIADLYKKLHSNK